MTAHQSTTRFTTRSIKSRRDRRTGKAVCLILFSGSANFRFSPADTFRTVAPMNSLSPEIITQHVRAALAEDIGSGDATTLATVPNDLLARAAMIAREEIVVCG